MEKQEYALKRELKEQLTLISSERNQFHSELMDASSQLKIAREQVQVLQQQQAVKMEEEEATRKRIAQLMSQVEGMLTQEVSDSNMVIASVHEKMVSECFWIFSERTPPFPHHPTRECLSYSHDYGLGNTMSDVCIYMIAIVAKHST